MSWFNRRPRVKEPPKLTPHHLSPLSRKILQEQKQAVAPKNKIRKKDNSI